MLYFFRIFFIIASGVLHPLMSTTRVAPPSPMTFMQFYAFSAHVRHLNTLHG
jgi:hypothetical protein